MNLQKFTTIIKSIKCKEKGRKEGQLRVSVCHARRFCFCSTYLRVMNRLYAEGSVSIGTVEGKRERRQLNERMAWRNRTPVEWWKCESPEGIISEGLKWKLSSNPRRNFLFTKEVDAIILWSVIMNLFLLVLLVCLLLFRSVEMKEDGWAWIGLTGLTVR